MTLRFKISYIFVLFLLSSSVGLLQCGFSFGNDYCNLESGCNSTTVKSKLLDDKCFKAAFFEHNRIDETNLIETTKTNLNIHNQAIELAALNGARIIVLPEDGIFWDRDRESIKPMLEELPDPRTLSKDHANPCLQPAEYEAQPILSNLSCAAKQNNIYVVANFGTKKSCEPGSQIGIAKCPDTGFLILNTDIALAANGDFIAKYYKYNTFLEIFDQAPIMERVYFDTEFGRFGIFTCFDILFKEPAVDLVEKDKVDTIVFPTWWYDETPFLTATQFQDAWSARLRVNLISANMHRRELGSIGSGSFSKDSKAYTDFRSPVSQLVISELPVEYDSATKCDANVVKFDIDRGQTVSSYNHYNLELAQTDTIQQFDKFIKLMRVCNGDFCCRVDYKLADVQVPGALERTVFIVRDSLRTRGFQWYEQICGIATLLEPWKDGQLAGVKFHTNGLMMFDNLTIFGDNFSSPYVYPIASYKAGVLVENAKRLFNCDAVGGLNGATSCKLTIDSPQEPIFSAGLYGRVYDKDNITRTSH